MQGAKGNREDKAQPLWGLVSVSVWSLTPPAQTPLYATHASHPTHTYVCLRTPGSSCLGSLILSCLSHRYLYPHLFHYQEG